LARLKAAGNGEIIDFEYRIRRRDGEWRWVASRAMPFKLDENGVVQFISASVDITERKQVERAQRESHKQYETLVQSIDGIVWEADPRTFAFTFVSKQAERILGYPLESWFEGPNFWPDHMHPEDRDQAVALCLNATARREDHQFEYRMIAADGHVVWLNDIVTVHIVDDQTTLLRGVMVDITERKLAEEKLKQSETQLAEAQHLANVGSWNWSLEDNILSWSDELYHIFGVQPAEFVPTYEKVVEFFHPEDRDLLRLVLDTSLETHEPFSYYYRIIRPDGKERIIHSNGQVTTDVHGTPTRMFGAAQDVTESKRAEDELRKQKEILQKIFDCTPMMIAFIGVDGRTKLVNREWERTLGWSSEEVITGEMEVLEQLYPDPAYRQEVMNSIARASGEWGDFKTRVRDGRIIDTRWANVLLSDGTSIGIGKDITAEKLAETELRESEERYRDLVESSKDLICTHDLQGLVLSTNRAAAVALGYPPKEFPVRMNLRDYLAPEVRDQFDEYLNTIQNEGFAKGVMVVQTNTGERRFWEYYNTLRTEGVETPIVRGMAHDITERRRAEEALRHAERKYRDIFENAGEGIFQSTPEGRFLAANPELARIHGFDSPEELISSRIDITREVYADPERRKEFKHLLDAFGMVRGFEHQVLRKDGSRIWISVNARVVRDEQGSIRYYEGTAQDITDRKQAEEALRESEERYRDLFENAKDAIYVQDLKGTYLSVNRAAENLSGYDRNEIIGKHFEQFVAPEYLPLVCTNFTKKLVDKEQTAYEVEVITKDGRRVPVELNSTLIFKHGVPVGIQGIARDIAERKRAVERLREYEKVVEGVEEMIAVVDRDYRYLIANRAFLNHRGLKREELVGRLVPELMSAEIFEKFVKRNLDECFKGNVVKYEVKVPCPIGERDLFVTYFPIEGADGVDRVACVLKDITDQKRAQDELRQSEERFSKAFHSSPAALSVGLLEDGKLIEVNDAFLRMTGHKRDEVIGKTTLELGFWSDSDDRVTMAGMLQERGAVTDFEIDFRKKSGEVRNGLFSVDLIELSGKPCVLGIVQDITERKRAESALRNYSRKLIEAQEAERQHIARELHDQIGQVLTAIRMNLQTIGNTCVTDESQVLIDQGITIIDSALDQVRDLSFELRPSLLDGLGLVAALRWYSDQYALRTGINTKTSTNLPEGQTRLREELETACFRIVQEALTNVVRHAKAKNVFIDLRKLDHKILLSVRDDGIGFDKRSANGGASAIHLGLRGMKERALALSGTLEIESAPARGTEVRASFPTNGKED
jgi:PAS domain S-box-containing protein